MVLKKREVEEDVYTLALERTRRIFDRFDHIAVSFSGGKDSTVALNVALAVHEERGLTQPLDVIFWDEEAIHAPTIEYVERVARLERVDLRWLCWPIKHRNACSTRQPWWYPWAPEQQHLWCRPWPFHGLPPPAGFPRLTVPECNGYLWGPELGSVAVIMGIRAQESLRRYRSVATREYDNYLSVDMKAMVPFSSTAVTSAPSHITLAKPIYDWTTEDVWTAPERFGWDYNRTYDVMRAAGIKPHDQRVCPPYGEEPLRGLWQYAVCFPELWEKMVARVPGAAFAARYCRTPIMGFGDRAMQPPEGMTWRQAIRHALDKWPEDVRSSIARRIQDDIRDHNRKTGNATIPDTAPAGLTWSFLYMVAVRGDLKRRKQSNYADYAPKTST